MYVYEVMQTQFRLINQQNNSILYSTHGFGAFFQAVYQNVENTKGDYSAPAGITGNELQKHTVSIHKISIFRASSEKVQSKINSHPQLTTIPMRRKTKLSNCVLIV